METTCCLVSVHRHPNLFSFFRVEAAEASSDLNLVSRGAFNSPRKSSLGNIADFFALTLMERGCLQSRVGSDEVRLEGGAITLWDPSQPVSYEFEGHVRHLTLLVRRDICTSIMPGIDRMASASILPNDGMALLLGQSSQDDACRPAAHFRPRTFRADACYDRALCRNGPVAVPLRRLLEQRPFTDPASRRLH
jgi:hypothetical protein